MRRVATLIGVVSLAVPAALLASPDGSPASQTARASVALVSKSPVTVRGTGFRVRERVQVRIEGSVARTRSIRATAGGAFVVRFDGVTVTRCDMVRIVAIGGAGSRAVQKYLPAPACLVE